MSILHYNDNKGDHNGGQLIPLQIATTRKEIQEGSRKSHNNRTQCIIFQEHGANSLQENIPVSCTKEEQKLENFLQKGTFTRWRFEEKEMENDTRMGLGFPFVLVHGGL